MLIVRGRGGRELLAQTLSARGADVTYLETYERAALEQPGLFADLEASGITVAVVTSGEILATLAGSVDARGRAWLDVIVPSGRVAAQAEALGFRRVILADGASDQAIVRAANGLA